MMAASETMMFKMDKGQGERRQDILFTVYKALNEKGYNPINQLLAISFREILHTSPIILMRGAS